MEPNYEKVLVSVGVPDSQEPGLLEGVGVDKPFKGKPISSFELAFFKLNFDICRSISCWFIFKGNMHD